MKTKCMILDDEPLAIEVLKSHIKKVSSLETTACFGNVVEAGEWLNRNKVDLLFLDIQMPSMKGTDFIRTLKDPPSIILTTAYREYALEGYDLGILDYLVKPISFERFYQAVNKFLYPAVQREIITLNQPEDDSESFIYVKVHKKIHKIILQDILFIDSLKDYITIHTYNRKITAKYTMTAMEDMLPQNRFIRIHRSYIVSIRNITGFTANTIDVAGVELPIGRNYKQFVLKILNYTE